MRPTVRLAAVFGIAAFLVLFLLRSLVLAAPVEDAGVFVDAMGVSLLVPAPDVVPALDVDRLVGAVGAKDWHIVLAVCLGFLGAILRRLTPISSFAHSAEAIVTLALVNGGISAAVPALVSHAPAGACALAAVMAMLSTWAAMQKSNARFVMGPLAPLLLLVVPLSLMGCATFGEQPVALRRAERDAFACAAPVAQAAILRFTPVAMDALAGEDAAWRAALADVEAAGASAIVCTVAHLLYDALGIDGVQAVAARDLERAVERELVIAGSGGGAALVESPHRRVLRRGLEVLRDYRQRRGAAEVL